MHPHIIIDSISQLHHIRLDKGAIEQRDKALTERIKTYMRDSGLTEIWDEEISLGVGLQERKSSRLDLVRMASDHPELVVALAAAGLLSASMSAIDKRPEIAVEVVDYVERAPSVFALTVKEAF